MMIPQVDLSYVLDDSNVHQRVVDEYFAASHLTVLAQRPVTGPSSVFSKGTEEGRSVWFLAVQPVDLTSVNTR